MPDSSSETSAHQDHAAPEQQQSARSFAAFRLPPFSAEDMGLWLAQVDCACRVAGIKDDAVKFDLVAANLPQAVAMQVRDVVTASPPNYQALTTALRDRLAQSRADRLTSLLRHQQLGDQRPSQLLRNMKAELGAAGDGQQDVELLRMLFLQRLPPPVRAALSLLAEQTPLDQLATAADRYLDASVAATGMGIAAVTASEPAPAVLPTPQDSMVSMMQSMGASLTAAVGRMEAALTDRERPVPRHSSPQRNSNCGCGHRCEGQTQRRLGSRGRARSQSRGRGQQDDNGLCYYHARFGEEAHRCRPPCTWQGNATA